MRQMALASCRDRGKIRLYFCLPESITRAFEGLVRTLGRPGSVFVRCVAFAALLGGP